MVPGSALLWGARGPHSGGLVIAMLLSRSAARGESNGAGQPDARMISPAALHSACMSKRPRLSTSVGGRLGCFSSFSFIPLVQACWRQISP